MAAAARILLYTGHNRKGSEQSLCDIALTPITGETYAYAYEGLTLIKIRSR